jgi:hypothetical protein
MIEMSASTQKVDKPPKYKINLWSVIRTRLSLRTQKWEQSEVKEQGRGEGKEEPIVSRTSSDGGRKNDCNCEQDENVPIAINQHWEGDSNVTHDKFLQLEKALP